MLNYTSKIQHFLNLHRKHTKYIVVLLLLSAFVASFVCSALTEPAVSMTEPIQMGQNVTLLADGDQSDGLPIISGHYENSQFKDYIKWDTQTSTDGRLLGSAHNFALFAFEEINIKTPCYGNLVSKKLNVNANFGLENIASAGGQSITIATESFLHGGGAQSKNTVLLVPQNVNFYNEQGNPVTINPIPKVQIKQPDGTTGHFEKGTIDVYAYHVTSGFIDFTAEKNNFITLQIWLVNAGNGSEQGNYKITRDNDTQEIRKIEIENKGVNYLNINYNELPTNSKDLNLYLAEDAAVIINVDCKDVTENIKTSFQFREYQNGDEIGNNSEAYLKGTNVLWNFYNSNDTNYQFDKEIHIGNSSSGIILAPSSNVYLNSQHTGGVIANKIETSATFTKAMFMTSMESFASGSIAVMAKKNWQNNEIPEGASVQVELYRSKTPNVDITNLPDGEKVGDTLTLNADNYWNATWFDLDQSYYYYVKELPVSANGKFYKAAYTNNGRNTTGTVDIENSIMEIESGGDNEGGETETPTQTIDITVEIKSNPTNLFYNSNEETNGKNISLYRTTTPNLTVDKLPTGDNIVPETGKIKEADRDKFPSDMELVISDLPEYDINNNKKQKSYFIRQKDNWQHTFKDQPMFDENGKPYYYYAKETWHQTDSTIGYENVYLGNGAYLKDSTITMYAIKTIDINVTKAWKNSDNSDNNTLNDHPSSVKFEIWRSYTQQQSIPSDAQWVSTNELNSNNNWSAKVKNVPISDINNNTYYYYIKETEIENNSSKLNEYDISYSTNAIYSDKANDANDSHSIAESNITITNKKKAEDKISITVKKDMRGKDNDDWNNQTFEFTLYKGNAPDNMWSLGQTYKLTKSNNWEITINDLEKNNNGQPYYYRVDETNTPSTFNATYSTESLNAGTVSGNGTIWIYNNPKKVSLNIKKFWEPIDIVNKIEYVKIKVYQVKSTDYQSTQALILSNGLDINSYINMLNGSSNPTINGNTVTYSNLSFTEAADKTNYNYEIRIDLSQFTGNTLKEYKINFDTNSIIFGLTSGIPNHMISCGNNHTNMVWGEYALNNNNGISIIDDIDFIITSYEDVSYKVSSLELTFQNEITTGGSTTPSEPEQDDNTNNTVVLTNPGYDENRAYSACKYNYYFNLSSYEGRQITKLEFKFNKYPGFENLDNSNGNHYILIGSQSGIVNNNNLMLIKTEQDFYQCYYNNAYSGCTYDKNNNILTYQVGTNGDNYQSLRSISNGDYLVFTIGRNNKEDFTIESLTLTFADSGGDEIYSDVAYQTFNKSDYNPNKDGSDKIEHNNLNTIDIPSKYSGKRVTKVESYFYNRQGCQGYTNDDATWQTVYNIWANRVNTNNNDVTNGDISENASWNNNVFTKKFTYNNGTQGYISGFGFKTPYPDHLEKVVITFEGGSTYTVVNNKWTDGKIHYSDNKEFVKAEYDENTKKMTSGDTNYFVTEYSNNPYNGKTVNNIQYYFYGLKDEDKNNGTLYEHTLNVWARGFDNNNVYSNGSNWSNNVLTQTYPNNVSGFSVRTRYPNNVEKVVVNYTDGSTFTLYNSIYNGTHETITIPTDSTYIERTGYGFENSDYLQLDSFMVENNENAKNLFGNMKLLSAKIYYNKRDTFTQNDTDFQNNIFNIIVQSNGSEINPSDSKWDNNILTRTYNGQTPITALYIKTYSNSYIQNFEKIELYFDSGMLTVKSKKYDSSNLATGSGSTPTGEEHIVFNVDFYDGLCLEIRKDSQDNNKKIPSSFSTKKVLSIEAYFENLSTFDMNAFDSETLDMWVNGYNYYDLNSVAEKSESENIRLKDYLNASDENKTDITIIGIGTKQHHQNLNYVVVRFEDGSTITIYNNKYYEKVGGTPAEGTTSSTTTTTTLPSDGFITEITLTETNNWSATLNDLPMVAPDGTPYYYFIVEVEIGYTDGTVLSGIDNITKKFDVTKNKEYLELSDEDGAENLLSITNKLKTTNTTMPSTGGIGTHPYRNAGILMMICSGGIYISLRALRKKQN